VHTLWDPILFTNYIDIKDHVSFCWPMYLKYIYKNTCQYVFDKIFKMLDYIVVQV